MVFAISLSNKPKIKNSAKPTGKNTFKVYNYLKKPIKVSIVKNEKNQGQNANEIEILSVEPQHYSSISHDIIVKHLKPENIIRFYIVNAQNLKQHYADYFIDTEYNERIKNLHVGMVTTRFIGKNTDLLRSSVVNANASQSMPFVKVHNITNLPLNLNIIHVEPNRVSKYKGYLHMGVPLGTYFNDLDDLYPSYQYIKPYSDIYFGVISDLQQPSDGCLQNEFSDIIDASQTLWPMQEGVY